MKNRYTISSLALVLVVIASLTSCKKTAPNIFNMFDVTLELHQNSSYSLTENQTLNEGDSIYFDFTITSPSRDMYQVVLQAGASGLGNLRITLDDAHRRSYTGVIKGIVGANGAITSAIIPGANGGSIGNLKNGANTFRIWAYDQQGIYMGDGYKKININVVNEITHIVNRKIYFPDVDSANGSAYSYLSLTTGETFNYQTGAANSAKIDLGIYRTKTVASNGVITWGPRMYSLSASPVPYLVNDISSWTKKETKFANGQNSQATPFLRNYYTAEALRTYVRGRNPNLLAHTANLSVGQGVPFVFPDGRYGLILINQISLTGDRPFMDVSIKYEL
ncbi:MAG: hypothetical protein QM594_22585 [Niabella sp.]